MATNTILARISLRSTGVSGFGGRRLPEYIKKPLRGGGRGKAR
jgi:hypothetical protein